MAIADTIYKQLGGRRFAVMTGAKNFVSGKDYLAFKIPRSKKINYVKITLTPMDTYNIEFGYMHGTKYSVTKEVEDVYVDMLRKTFEDATGLYTSL